MKKVKSVLVIKDAAQKTCGAYNDHEKERYYWIYPPFPGK